ncbi:hypothetical protein BVX97_03175 [bacterium E08(2017)]|nr:hypothetical protein BVX97_03175 [bacterium E08(2017)]
MANRRVLCVDDEESVLQGFKRNLRKAVELDTATSPEQGLAAIRDGDEYAVIVSDMQMPGMNGIEFLKEAQKIKPDSVRMMLTGMSDQKTAVDAVNEGAIFRFMTKPCPAEVLIPVLEAGIRQYELVTAEKELLEKTLKGSINVLVDMLSMANPAAFSRAMRIKDYVVQLTSMLELKDAWEFEVSAMLSQIGYVTIPPETMEKYMTGRELTDSEKEMLAGHSSVAKNLIGNIPRLESVAEIISTEECKPGDIDTSAPSTETGPKILKASIAFDALLTKGESKSEALTKLRKDSVAYGSTLLDLLSKLETPDFEAVTHAVHISNLRSGNVLAEDVHAKNGMLIVAKGQQVSPALRTRLDNFAKQGAIGQEVLIHTAALEDTQ